jgi:hypothetical protein
MFALSRELRRGALALCMLIVAWDLASRIDAMASAPVETAAIHVAASMNDLLKRR